MRSQVRYRGRENPVAMHPDRPRRVRFPCSRAHRKRRSSAPVRAHSARIGVAEEARTSRFVRACARVREDIWVPQKARAKYFLLTNQRIANLREQPLVFGAAVKACHACRADGREPGFCVRQEVVAQTSSGVACRRRGRGKKLRCAQRCPSLFLVRSGTRKCAKSARSKRAKISKKKTYSMRPKMHATDFARHASTCESCAAAREKHARWRKPYVRWARSMQKKVNDSSRACCALTRFSCTLRD